MQDTNSIYAKGSKGENDGNKNKTIKTSPYETKEKVKENVQKISIKTLVELFTLKYFVLLYEFRVEMKSTYILIWKNVGNNNHSVIQ